MSLTSQRQRVAASWGVQLAWLGGIVLAALLGLNWARFAYHAYLSLIFPGQIDYGEGIVWQQALLIPGPRMYGDLQQYPFIVFHYPPLYHLAVRLLAMLGLPWLMAGRLISSVSAVIVAASAGALVFEAARQTTRRRAAASGALLAALLIASFGPIHFWARTMRVDMLAVALEFLGIYLGLLSLRRPRLAYAAAFVFVLAAYTKQTELAGAIATFAVLLIRTPARAMRAAAAAVLAGIIAFAALTVATHGGFPKHVILYNVNRFSLAAVITGLRSGGVEHYLPCAAIAAGTALAVFARLGHGGGLRAAPPGPLMFSLLFLLTSASLISLGKSGAASNYLITWMSSLALLVGIAAAAAANALSPAVARPLPAFVLLALLIPQALMAETLAESRLVDPAYRRQYGELVRMIRHAGKPVFSDDMVLLMQAGREVPWEPAIITELSAKGLFDEAKIIRLIDEHAFACMIVGDEPGAALYDARHSPAVAAAIERDYPVDRMLAGLHVRLPSGDDAIRAQ